MRPHPGLVIFLLAAVLGLFFTGWSTLDFVQHLDRQTHSLHCSFLPGIAQTSVDADSGCHVALMSPYSSWFRWYVWGGIPAALAGIGVFAFLVFRGLELWLAGKQRDPGAALFLLIATLVPVVTSIVYAGIALMVLDAVCKLCVGIYLSSLGTMIGAAWLWLSASRAHDEDEDPSTGPLGWLLGVGEGVAFVALPVWAYLAMMPDFTQFVGTCGTLEKPEDPNGILVSLATPGGEPSSAEKVVAIEVLDPLCPSCRGFEDRLEKSGLGSQLDRKILLFPLDDTCNWNVSYAVHPGACVVSEAVLCAGDRADQVLNWAFVNQANIRDRAKADPKAAEQVVIEAFPELQGCVGSEKSRQRLNRSLRWAVANHLPVLTPQLYVNGLKLCDEDVDLGLDWTLTRLIEEAR